MKFTRKTTFRILSGALVLGILGSLGAAALHAQATRGDKSLRSLDDIESILSNSKIDAQQRVDEALAAIAELKKRDAARPPRPQFADPLDGFAGFDDRAFAFGGSWDPFAEMQRMRAMTDQMFNGAFARMNADPAFAGTGGMQAFAPTADVVDKGDAYELRFELPGVDKGDVSLEVKDGRVTVKGTRNSVTEEQGANGQTIRRESSFGSFERTVPLPGPVDEDRIEAKQQNGVLVVTLPKQGGASDKPVQVPIK